MSSAKSASSDCRSSTRRLTGTQRSGYLARLCSIALFAASLQAAALPPNEPLGRPVNTGLTLHFDDHGLDIDARNAELSEVLSQLGEQAGIRIRYSKQRLGQTTVSLSLNDTPLNKAIALILQGHSYLLNLDDQARTLVVLSTGRGTKNRSVIPKSIGVRNLKTKASTAPSSTKDKKNPDSTTATASEPALESVIEDAANSLYGEDSDEVSALEPSMAMEQLAAIDHPDATELIIRATSDNSNVVDRALAADALWQHASNQSFADPEVNQALERLAADADASVRNIAEQALSDMQAYLDKEQ